MKSLVRRVAVSLSLAAVAVTPGVVGAGPAAAADYSVPGVCGSGYREVWKQDVSYWTAGGFWKKLGTVFVGYNSGSGNNCAYTLKYSGAQQVNFWGYPTTVGVKLLTEGNTWSTEYGNFKYYAGPRKLYGKGRCVKVVADVWLGPDRSGINAHYASGGWIPGLCD